MNCQYSDVVLKIDLLELLPHYNLMVRDQFPKQQNNRIY